MPEPVWILEDVARAIHQRQIAEHGGAGGIRDNDLLESALAKPKHLYFYTIPKPDSAALAAAYACGISSNHAFLDGNKRTAFVVCRLFLKLNGYELEASESEKYQTFMKLAAGELTEDNLGNWIRRHLKNTRGI